MIHRVPWDGRESVLGLYNSGTVDYGGGRGDGQAGFRVTYGYGTGKGRGSPGTSDGEGQGMPYSSDMDHTQEKRQWITRRC